METTSQLTVLAANQPGTLAEICASLAAKGVNILGMNVIDHVDFAMIRMVVDQDKAAVHILGEAGLLVMESELIRLSLGGGPGVLEKIARILGEGKFNIEYMYATEAKEGNVPMAYLKTNDNEGALKLIREKLVP